MKTHVKAILLFLMALGLTGAVVWFIKSRRSVANTIEKFVASNFPGFSGSLLVAKDGKIIVKKSYGYADAVQKIKNSPSTIFKIGSVSKTFTGILTKLFIEQGLLKADDTINKYISYPRGDEITIKNLITNTSGIPNIDSLPNLEELQVSLKTLDEAIDTFKDMPLNFTPGEKFEYSNSGFLVLTKILEKVSGKTYDELLREYITGPLHMQHTDLIGKNAALGYIDKNGTLVDPLPINMDWIKGAGGIYSTVEDLYAFDRGLNTDKLLKKSQLDEMYTPVKGTYGFGWNTGAVCGHSLVGHIGNIEGFSAALMRFIKDDLCIVVLANLEEAPVEKIGLGIAEIIFDCKNK